MAHVQKPQVQELRGKTFTGELSQEQLDKVNRDFRIDEDDEIIGIRLNDEGKVEHMVVERDDGDEQFVYDYSTPNQLQIQHSKKMDSWFEFNHLPVPEKGADISYHWERPDDCFCAADEVTIDWHLDANYKSVMVRQYNIRTFSAEQNQEMISRAVHDSLSDQGVAFCWYRDWNNWVIDSVYERFHAQMEENNPNLGFRMIAELSDIDFEEMMQASEEIDSKYYD